MAAASVKIEYSYLDFNISVSGLFFRNGATILPRCFGFIVYQVNDNSIIFYFLFTLDHGCRLEPEE